MHHRSSLKNAPSGWGNYSLTFMGHHRMYYYRELTEKLMEADIGGEGQEAFSHVMIWLCLARVLQSEFLEIHVGYSCVL